VINYRACFGPLAVLALLGCNNAPGTAPPPTSDSLRLVPVVTSGLSRPVYLSAPTGDTSRLFVVEQSGQIRIVQHGQLLPAAFLDIQTRLVSGGEQGLLSVAFHPNYATNGYFYVNYTDLNGDTRVERYTVSAADSNLADTATHKLIIFIPQPYTNHNGGLVMFGPDGMLYIGMGDGGSAGDPQNRAQSPDSLLGKLLRIDVDGGDPYAIPAGNPFATSGGAKEIWALGLRNPWRFAFDRSAGLLYIGDVGQARGKRSTSSGRARAV
jgi:glucose/arabinose dehydrogenase